MLSSYALWVSAVVALIGALIFWSNPARMVNRLVFTCSLHIAAWLAFLNLTITSARGSPDGLFWLRWTYAISASLPLHFFFVKESIVAGLGRDKLKLSWRMMGWVSVSLVLTVIPFTEVFIPSYSVATQPVRGWAYHGYEYGIVVLYAFLFRDSLRTIKTVGGAQRLELQVWLVGGCASAATILALKALSTLTHDPFYVGLQPFVALVYYGGTAYAITASRIFDARQLVLVVVEKIILIVAVACVAYLLDLLIGEFLSPSLALLATTALALWFAAAVNSRLDRTFQFYPQGTAARQAAYAVARREIQAQGLEQAFLSILKGWGQTDRALMLSGTKSALEGGGVELPQDCATLQILRQLRWATPERLAREKSAPEREELGRFLQEQRLGVVVLSEGPTLTLLVGVGVPASRRPFTTRRSCGLPK